MGIIYWDYETEEVIKVKIAIEGSSFYNAVWPFSIPSFDLNKITGKDTPKQYLIIAKMDKDAASLKGMVWYILILFRFKQKILDFIRHC